MNRTKVNKYFIIVLCLFALGCYEEKMGCLNVNSSNYDVTADEGCDDCCTFPSLGIEVTHRMNGESFSLEDTITNNLGQQFIFQSFHYFLSDFQLSLSEASILESFDSLSIVNYEQETISVLDNFSLISKSVFSKDIHSYSNVDPFEEISFSLGIASEVNHSLELTLPSGHPLATSADSLYLDPDQGYVFGRARIIRGEEFLDTLIFTLTGDENLKTFNFQLDSLVLRGTDFDIPLLVEYSCWFDDMNLNTGTASELQEQFNENILCSISIN